MFSWLFGKDKYQKVTLDSDQVEQFHQKMDDLDRMIDILLKERSILIGLTKAAIPRLQRPQSFSSNAELLCTMYDALDSINEVDDMFANRDL